MTTLLRRIACFFHRDRFAADLGSLEGDGGVDRDALIRAFQSYLDANDLEADWKSVRAASNEALVNTLINVVPTWDIDRRLYHRGARTLWGPVMQRQVWPCADGYIAWKWFVARGRGRRNTPVIEWMKANPSQDPIFGEGNIRADGRHMHDMFLMEVNAPDKAQYEGDYFTVLATIPAEKAFRPLEEGGCPLVK